MASRPKPVTEGEKPGKLGWVRRTMPRDEKVVRQGILDNDKDREGLVRRLRASVWAGTYNPDVNEVAEALLAEREAEWRTTRQEEEGSTT